MAIRASHVFEGGRDAAATQEWTYPWPHRHPCVRKRLQDGVRRTLIGITISHIEDTTHVGWARNSSLSCARESLRPDLDCTGLLTEALFRRAKAVSFLSQRRVGETTRDPSLLLGCSGLQSIVV